MTDIHRILLAPTAETGEFIAAVYNFDETRVLDVAASCGARGRAGGKQSPSQG
ncbi:hypothetical protein [Arthrobacter sp. U41]|uniref:hypothetical protein n=1 Tax=Arthrobacter sp. U41 TaxID=1849032 RepID=UPI0012F7C36A|nr:hypothetical protein [Arthrobacter sp. U41]